MSGDETADAIADHDNELIAAYRESPEYLDDLFERIADDREFERTVSRRWAIWLRRDGHESTLPGAAANSRGGARRGRFGGCS